MSCKHDPRETKGPIGMYHCPECGQMVIAGIEHIDYDSPDDSPFGNEELDMSYLSNDR